MSRIRLPARLALCLLMCALALGLRYIPVGEHFEFRLQDLAVRMVAAEHRASPEIVLIAIDDDSLERVDVAWPWYRAFYASMIDYAAGASVIAIDILLADADSRLDSKSDAELVRAMREHGNVILATQFTESAGAGDLDLLRRSVLPAIQTNMLELHEFPQVVQPDPSFLAACSGIGAVSHQLDSDGVLRRYRTAVAFHGEVYPSIALAATMRHLGVPATDVTLRHRTLMIGDQRMPLAADGTFVLLPMTPPHKVYSAADVLDSWYAAANHDEPIIPASAFDGKLVFIGSFATGLADDELVTATNSTTSGVAINAMGADNLIHSLMLQPLSRGSAIALAVLLCVLMALPELRSPRLLVLTSLMVVAVYLAVTIALLLGVGLVLPFTAPVLAPLLSGVALGVRYWRVEMVRRFQAEQDLIAANQALSVTNEKLAEYSRTLEVRVDERTTELREKNDELESTLAQLKRSQQQLVMREKMASLGALTTGVAHEIRNPLNFINNFALLSKDLVNELTEMMAEAESLPAEARQEFNDILADLSGNAEKITTHGSRVERIVKGMIAHSQQQSGERSEIDLNDFLQEYVSIVYNGRRNDDSNFRAVIDTELSPDLPRIEVMPQEFARVLYNVFVNAFDAMQLRAKTEDDNFVCRLTLKTRDTGDWLEVRIQDNGGGIPAEIRDQVFEPFFTTRVDGSGVGLGLSISYEIIVTGHAGKIGFEPVPGGVECVISLPKVRSAQPAGAG